MKKTNQTRTVIIQASSRSNGNTSKIADYILQKTNFDIIDLKTKQIGHYDYEYKNNDDDFLPLITQIIRDYDTIVFATPVYWYSMSGILKVFFDRISDLLTIHKDIGRKLRGKQMAVISCSNVDDLIKGFDMPFRESANYLGMPYLGHINTWLEGSHINIKAKDRIDAYLNEKLL